MPKPIAMDSGSGMHVNVSLWKGKTNVFYDSAEDDELSQTARYFCGGILNHSKALSACGGILNHAKALSAICNPTTNSYHRLVPGYEAPAYIAWSSGNRSAIVRVPIHLTGKNYAYLKRLEFRAPDPSANPYLAFAAITAAGMDGIKKKTDPGEQIREDIFKMTKSDRAKKGIGVLPKSLGEALDELESDRKFLNPIFTNDVIDKIIELERRDQREIAIRPHPHEFYLYFDV
jgi:glutamine synthetase